MFDSQETLRHLQLGALDNSHVYCLDIDHGVLGCQVDIFIWVWINTYKNTIFRGMNIHKFQLFDVNYRGTIGFDTLPYVFKSSLDMAQRHELHLRMARFETQWFRMFR